MKKRSLHIGVNNYPGTESDLSGCVNDAHAWKHELNRRGFEWQDILLDENATHKAMCEAIADIVVATKENDIAVITYSGHGTWTPTSDLVDEPDGRDEALCPYDLDDKGPLGDNYLHTIFKEKTPGSKIVFISDSCHSGSVSRVARAKDSSMEISPLGQRIKFLPPSYHMTPEDLLKAHVIEGRKGSNALRYYCLLLSGCKDSEYSYDAWFEGKAHGALTYIALWTLKKLGKNASYAQWYKKIREYLPHQMYPQTPQLTGSMKQKDWKVFE